MKHIQYILIDGMNFIGPKQLLEIENDYVQGISP